MKPQSLVNINRKRKKRSSKPEESLSTTSAPNELLWALIGLLLTLVSTFAEAFTVNLPWNWATQGIQAQSLGVTYQIGAVLLTGCLGGRNAGALSQIAYVILGLVWLPIFAHGGGFNYWQEPSFGYILGFIPGAWLCGWMAFRRRAKLESLALSAICGLFIIHLCGLAYLLGLSHFNPANNELVSPTNLPSIMMNYSILPLPGQLAIVCAVAVIAFALRQVLFY